MLQDIPEETSGKTSRESIARKTMPGHNHLAEKRRYPRLKKNLPIKIKHEEFDLVTETKNISCAGAYCRVDRYIPMMTKLKIKILLPSKVKNNPLCINCVGTVVRVEKNDNPLESEYNVAIFFNEINKSSMNKINNFVKQQNRLG